MTQFSTTARPRALGVAGNPDEGYGEYRLPPQDIAAEKALLGSMIIDATCIGDVCGVVTAEDCLPEAHQILFRVLTGMAEENTPIDDVTLMGSLRDADVLDAIGGQEYLGEVLNTVPSSANALHYARIVKQASVRRGLIVAGTAMIRLGHDFTTPSEDALQQAQQQVFELADTRQTRAVSPIGQVLGEVMTRMDQQGSDAITGLPTGFRELDQLTSGFQNGETIVLGSRPSMGKTSMGMNIAEYVGVDLRRPVLVFSLEMSKQQLVQRMLSCRSQIDSHKIRRGMMTVQERDRIAFTVGELSGGCIHIDDSPGLTLLDMRTKCRKLKVASGLDLVVVDYLQLMEGPRGDSRQEQVAAFSRGLKGMARELGVPVLVMAQINRAPENDGRLPRTSDLRESGAIEADADVVLLLHREAVLHRGDHAWADANPGKVNVADIIVAKNRNGPCDVVKLTFLQACTRFVNYTQEY